MHTTTSHQTTNSPKYHKISLTQIYIKQNIHKHQTQNVQRISPFGTAPVKKAHKETLVSWTIPLIYEYQSFKKYKKRNGQKQ